MYSGSKSALDSVIEALATEVAPFGVRVHILMPGYFSTNIFNSQPLHTPDNPNPPGLSKVYTLDSQGYNVINRLPHTMRAGDPQKFAERVYEIVTDSGIAKDVMVNEQPWLRIPMSSGGGEGVLQKVEVNLEGFKATEPLWRSTDVTEIEPRTGDSLDSSRTRWKCRKDARRSSAMSASAKYPCNHIKKLLLKFVSCVQF